MNAWQRKWMKGNKRKTLNIHGTIQAGALQRDATDNRQATHDRLDQAASAKARCSSSHPTRAKRDDLTLA